MIDRRRFFSLTLKAAAATLVCAAAQAAAEQAAPEQAAEPNHPRRAARNSSPLSAQEAPAGGADTQRQPRAGSSSPVGVADDATLRSHARRSHAAARGKNGVEIAASLD